jgi:Spy/CpxP family protein refolding chaperone
MKTKLFFLATLLMYFLLVPVANAQRGRQAEAFRIPDLTEEQKSQIEVLRTQQITQSTQHRAAMDELRARIRALRIAENPDLNAINIVIDQMERTRAEHMKSREAHHQQVRNLLTPAQQAIFDSRAIGPRQGRGPGINSPRQGGRGNSNQQGRWR